MTDDRSTDTVQYAERLVRLQTVWWKRVFPVQAPYRWNLRRLRPGHTLDVGCGIGRNLRHLDGDGVGIDHNAESVRLARTLGLVAYLPEEFAASEHAGAAFDSLLFSHVAEHMTRSDFVALVAEYLPRLRPGGKVIVIVPQRRGYGSDATHVEFFDTEALDRVGEALKLRRERAYSFPFPQAVGALFAYNESVWVGVKP